MALPNIALPWQFRVNAQLVGTAASSFDVITLSQATLFHIKESLLGNGSWTDVLGNATTSAGNWTVSFSCNGAGGAGSFGAPGDGVDRWVSAANIIRGNGAAVRSWIVLKQPGISTNFEMCYEQNGGSAYEGTIVISPNSRFGFGTGSIGAANARPTADDEIVLKTAAAWGGTQSAEASNRVHVLKSADGSATRVVLVRNGFVCGYWSFEKPATPNDSWENPSVGYVVGTNASPTATQLDWVAVGNAALGVYFGRTLNYPSGVAFGQNVLLQRYSSGLGMVVDVQRGSNDLDGTTPFLPAQLYNAAKVGARGRDGALQDTWVVPANFCDGTTLPLDDTRQFIVVGCFAMPWNRSAPKWY